MTVRKPDDAVSSVVRGFFSDVFNLRNLVLAVATCLGAYYGVQAKVAVMQTQQDDLARRVDDLRNEMGNKVDKEQFQSMQTELSAMDAKLGQIEQFLMEHPR